MNSQSVSSTNLEIVQSITIRTPVIGLLYKGPRIVVLQYGEFPSSFFFKKKLDQQNKIGEEDENS